MNIRRATFYDSGALFRILMQMHAEAPALAVFPVEPAKIATMVNTVLVQGLALVAETDENGVVGSIGGIPSQGLWYSSQAYLGDLWFYVDPDFRQSRAAIELMDAFVKEGHRHNLPVQLGHVNGVDLDRKDKFFERRGLVKMGSIYLAAPEKPNG